MEEFERVQMGLEVKLGAGKKVVGRAGGKVMVEEEEQGGDLKGKKRKFELDEDELLSIAREERGKARKALDREKVCESNRILHTGNLLCLDSLKLRNHNSLPSGYPP